MVLIDTYVLLDIATRDPVWFDWSRRQLAPLLNAREAAIHPVIYAELAPLYSSERDLDLSLLPVSNFRRLTLPFAVGFPAARAFQAYRKSGGQRTSPLPAFSSVPMPKRNA